MLSYFYFIWAFMLIIFFILDGHRILYNTIVPRYQRWGRLKTLMSTRYKGMYKIVWISFLMVCKALYINFLQYMNSTVRMIDYKTYEITYIVSGKIYKMLVTPPRGPTPILQISDDTSNDVTDIVLPYLGPSFDWHGKVFSPDFFGHTSLTFELSDGSERTFEGKNHAKIE